MGSIDCFLALDLVRNVPSECIVAVLGTWQVEGRLY